MRNGRRALLRLASRAIASRPTDRGCSRLSCAALPRGVHAMPPRLTASDFDQELLILFDAYVHGGLDRRGFLSQAGKFAKAGVTATALLAALSPDFAAGQQVAPTDPKLKVERASYA